MNHMLNIKTKTIKPLQENIGVTLYNLRLNTGFLRYQTKCTSNKRKSGLNEY
jgi:hypothetical protein